MKSGIRFTVKHDIKGRIRIHLTRGRLSVRQADLFSFYLASLPQVTAAKVYERIGDAAITYTGSKEDLCEASCETLSHKLFLEFLI